MQELIESVGEMAHVLRGRMPSSDSFSLFQWSGEWYIYPSIEHSYVYFKIYSFTATSINWKWKTFRNLTPDHQRHERMQKKEEKLSNLFIPLSESAFWQALLKWSERIEQNTQGR